MSISLLMSGKIRNEKKFLKELKKIIKTKNYTFDEYDDESIIRVCYMGDVFVTVKNNTATIDTLTNLLGAGYHKYICGFFAELSKLFTEVYIEDDTEYFEHKDFERMKEEHFYTYISNLMYICSENRSKGGSVCRSSNNYSPKHIEGTVVSPFGRINIDEWLLKIEQGKISELAEVFYIWNNEEKDATYYRNFALSLMWEKLCYVKCGINEHQDQTATQVLCYLEKAAELDSKLPFPINEYLELCGLQDREPIDTKNLIPYISKYQIGYHKDITHQKLGNIKVAVLPKMLRDVLEDDIIWYNGQQDFYNFKVATYSVSPKKAEINVAIFENFEGEITTLIIGNGICKVAYEGGEEGLHSSFAVIACDEQLTIVTFFYAKKETHEQVVEHLKMFDALGVNE